MRRSRGHLPQQWENLQIHHTSGSTPTLRTRYCVGIEPLAGFLMAQRADRKGDMPMSAAAARGPAAGRLSAASCSGFSPKPQFGLMVPCVPAATGCRRTFMAATATVALLVLSVTLAFAWAFGPQARETFAVLARSTRLVVLDAGGTGWRRIQSVFSWVRVWGGPVGLVHAFRGTVTLGTMLVWLWRSAASFALKAAAFRLVALLATSHSLDDDMTGLAFGPVFLPPTGSHAGPLLWEKTALARRLTPLVARGVAFATLIPLGVLAMLSVLIVLLVRTAADQVVPPAPSVTP